MRVSIFRPQPTFHGYDYAYVYGYVTTTQNSGYPNHGDDDDNDSRFADNDNGQGESCRYTESVTTVFPPVDFFPVSYHNIYIQGKPDTPDRFFEWAEALRRGGIDGKVER